MTLGSRCPHGDRHMGLPAGKPVEKSLANKGLIDYIGSHDGRWPERNRGGVAMFSWQLDDELALLFLQPDMASELFRLCQRNRDYLSQWLPWVPHISSPPTAPPSFATPSRSLPEGGADHGHRVSGRWSASSVTTRSIRISAR
jgi:hypothetical protein